MPPECCEKLCPQPQQVDRALQRRIPTCPLPMFGLFQFQHLNSYPHSQPCFPKTTLQATWLGQKWAQAVSELNPLLTIQAGKRFFLGPDFPLPWGEPTWGPQGPFQPGLMVRTLPIHKALCFSKQGGECEFSSHEVPGLQSKCVHCMGGRGWE